MKHYSDQQISSYFLGKMPAEEAEAFEFEAAASPEFTERAEIIERELIDDYVRETLSDEDADCFEKKYLTTEARRNRLSVSKAIWQIAAEQPKTAVVPAVSVWQSIFGKRNALRLAFACAALLVCGAFAFYLLTLDVSKTDVAEVKEPNQTVKIENPPIQNPEETSSQKNEKSNSSLNVPVAQNKETEKDQVAPPKNQPETKPVTNPKISTQIKPALTVIAKLMPGSLRDEGEQFINLTPEAKNVKLLLSPGGEPNNYQKFRVFVKTPENETILTFANLKSLSATIPAEKLENRTYIIFLEGQNAKGEFESISEYTFRVRR